ncbi:hypothetical protein WA577_006677 [Blastocystis sp. JDR]
MSDFWARMPPFRDSIFLPSVRLLGSLRSECLFLGYVCFSLVSLLVVGSVVGCSVLPSVVRRLVVRRPVGRCRRSSCCRLSVVGRCRRPSVAGRRWSCRSSVVRFPFPVLRLPNCRGTLSPTAFHHGRPVCLLPPPGLLTVSQLSSSRLQLTLPTNRLGCLARASLRFPPPGFRSSASASGSASLVHFPSSSLRLPSPPWLSPGFSRSPGSVLSSSPRRSRQTSLGPVPRHSLRSLGLPRGFPSLRVPLLGFVSALPSGSLLGPLGSSFLASLPHFSGRPVHPCRLPAIHDLPWVRSDSHFPGSCSSFPSSASGVFSSLREGASIPPLHVMHFLSLPHSFFAMTGFWLSPTLYFVPYSSFSSYLPWVLLHF